MKKALVLLVAIAALLVAPGLEKANASDPVDSLPDVHVPIGFKN